MWFGGAHLFCASTCLAIICAMLYLLSPAKSLNYITTTPKAIAPLVTEPAFNHCAAELIDLLKQKTTLDIAELMNLSPNLATLNVARYAEWSEQAAPGLPMQSKPAVLAFNGDVYGGLDARSLNKSDLCWAQNHVIILSGLYGVLRPLDRLQPYRLEMGTRLINPKGTDLYAYWGDILAQYLNERMAVNTTKTIINLASQEYFKSINCKKLLHLRVVECVFENWKNGQYKLISFFAKKARGLMTRYAIENRVATVAQLKKFNADGYQFNADISSENRLVFRRRLTD
jgi:uncharacterized protein